MHKLFRWAVYASIVFSSLYFSYSSFAVGPHLVISQVQAGAASAVAENASTQEFISVYNNSNQPVDITDWCITNKSLATFVCFNSNQNNVQLILPGYSYTTISSDTFNVQNDYFPDFQYSTTGKSYGYIVASADTISLINADAEIIDSVSFSSLTGGLVYQRKPDTINLDELLDTDLSTDFEKKPTLVIPPNNKVEELETLDVCDNISGVQEILPDGMVQNGSSCDQIDVCSNLDGAQSVIPDGYRRADDNACVLDLNPLIITELLPNADGVDEDNEYIEIFNPNTTLIDLTNYRLLIGIDDKKEYLFVPGATIEAGQYIAFYNKDINFTLVNTDSNVQIASSDGSIINETMSYTNPKEGQSWALIDDIWQYTNQPTPNSANKTSFIPAVEEILEEDTYEPCAENQYRNPETNRCRLIVKSSSTVVPCKDGQYRSEETGRCRNIVSDVADLVPCAEGQERNPATNRCRSITSILGTNDLKPCPEGQERNPETNRCRNIVSVTKADYAPEKTDKSSNDNTLFFVLAGVATVAFSYAVWEWRREIVKLYRKIIPKHSNAK